MPINPSGKRRVMEAQSTLGMDNQWGVQGMEQSPDEQPAQGGVEDAPQTDIQMEAEAPAEDESDDLRGYVMKKMESLGYPPRRLEQFSDEFVEEEIFPGGVRDIKITIPDRYYGTRKSLSDKDLSQIIEDIQTKFGLQLASAKRREKKAVMQFQVQLKGKGEEEEEIAQKDDLDEIFGTPKSAKPQKKDKVVAQTIGELVTANRNDMFERLLSTLPESAKEEIKSQSDQRSNILNSLFQEK